MVDPLDEPTQGRNRTRSQPTPKRHIRSRPELRLLLRNSLDFPGNGTSANSLSSELRFFQTRPTPASPRPCHRHSACSNAVSC
ncbi:uncharacterized protein PHACADRAFT_248493 [Phanerochaete carnosa HHB-10118-sp]|uniref:Uncharacterized protein n=1 Tax=Phanerochaete carnosa (strain HHB-10118-sp) TaxID=650164 RepID=K5VFB5_PHACS|nr:uncharacterized protein PHACADRAFT_248493 [Phanerochaete carnosa HHB-10118-sp]EKM61721.1 hypothetical protein PHACADRAFT_248493 [Phanerochaete carnosa HHB-10118-sp]